MKFLIGSYTKKISSGIYTLDLNKDLLTPASTLDNPTFLDLNKDYIVSTYGMKNIGGVCLLDREFNILDKSTDFSCAPCYISLYNKYIFACNYHDGLLVAYKIHNKTLNFSNKFSVPNGKFHFCKVFNNSLFLVDLEHNIIYALDILTLKVIDKIFLSNSPKPRHLEFYKEYIYCITESSNELITLKFKNNKFTLISRYSIYNTPILNLEGCAIKIKNNFIYTSERKNNSFSVFKITNSSLTHLQTFSHFKINNSRDFTIENNMLFSSNLLSNEISIFSISKTTGLIDKYLKSIKALEPTFIKSIT